MIVKILAVQLLLLSVLLLLFYLSFAGSAVLCGLMGMSLVWLGNVLFAMRFQFSKYAGASKVLRCFYQSIVLRWVLLGCAVVLFYRHFPSGGLFFVLGFFLMSFFGGFAPLLLKN